MIPAELRALPQWVAWRVEQRRKPSGELVPTKVPYSHRGRKASSTDPSTWTTYRQALSVLDSDGVGFVFSPDDPYTGIDMDACVDGNGRVHDAAYQIVSAMKGYWEFSPSGHGLHIIVRGQIARGRHTLKTPWRDELAVYNRARFFTMSGEGRGEIREAQTELNALISYYFPEADDTPRQRPCKPLCAADSEVLDRIYADDRMARLWAGGTEDHGGDHSAADLALCSHLAFLTGGDVSRVDAMFRRSGLMRDKWDEPRGESTYGQMTVDKALRGGT